LSCPFLPIDDLFLRVSIFSTIDDFVRTGRMSRDELQRGLSDLGVSISENDFAVVWSALDPKGNGATGYDEFVRIMALQKQRCTGKVAGGQAKKTSSRQRQDPKGEHAAADAATTEAVEGLEVTQRASLREEAFAQWLKKKR
jgi:hypothetical protein